MKKLCVTILLAFIFLPVFSQTATDRPIVFEYEKRTNYFINQDGVYADTLHFKMRFPHLKYVLQLHPENGLTTGFVPMEKLSTEDKRILRSEVYHANERISGRYDPKKNRTVLTIVRDNSILPEYNNHIKPAERMSRFKYTITIDYVKGTIHYDFPRTERKIDLAAESCDIQYNPGENTAGRYLKSNNVYNLENLVWLDPSLDKKIMTAQVFNNNEFGVRKIVTVFETIELKAFAYE